MARALPDPSRLTLLLQTRGVLTGRNLTEELGISTPTMTRLIRRLGASVERIGAARNVRYALRRQVRNLGSQWPLYRLDDGGRPRVWGELRAFHGGFRFVPTTSAPAWMERNYPEGLFSGLPFFLQEVRPQGYLGRAIARDVASRLGAPADLRVWSDDDVLAYFLTDGGDLPGDLVVGDRALEHAIRAGKISARPALPTPIEPPSTPAGPTPPSAVNSSGLPLAVNNPSSSRPSCALRATLDRCWSSFPPRNLLPFLSAGRTCCSASISPLRSCGRARFRAWRRR